MPTEKQIHEGHRRRMYARVERDGFDSLAPHEALEYLLYFTNARRDTNALAHALLDRFGDFASVLEASEEDLMQVDGIGPTTARLLHGLLPVSRYYARTCAGKKRSLNTTESLAEFLQAQFLHLQQERAMLISLNRSRQVRSAVWLREGGRQAVWLDIQEIVTAALKGGTSVVVLCHNHPNGMVLPSMEDMRATGEVVRALGLVGIQLTDHIIVTQEEYYSMREQETLPFYDAAAGIIRWPQKRRCVQSKGPYKRMCAMGRKDFERLPQQERQFLALCLASVVLCGVLAVFFAVSTTEPAVSGSAAAPLYRRLWWT